MRPASAFAFSLASTAFEPPHVVLASADGVAYFWAGCESESLTYGAHPEEPPCNDGHGNYVRVQHTPDLYTQYQHLSAVLINWGQPVKRGQPIGFEGNTGGANAKQIRWSAHRGTAVAGGPSIPMSRIRHLGGVASSSTWKCGDWLPSTTPDAAPAYRSDNVPVAPPDPVGFTFAPSKPNDLSKPDFGLANRLYQRVFRSPQELAKLRALPDVGDNRYWLGAALQELKKNAEAERVLRRQQGRPELNLANQQWIDLRLAELTAARGANREARALLEKCRAASDQPVFKQRWEAVWMRIRSKAK